MEIYPFEQYRKLFPILKNKIQLSSCSQSAIATTVTEAVNNYLSTIENEGMNWELWMGEVYAAKSKFAKLINADVDEIAILSSVSDAISTVVTSLLQANEKKGLVTTDLDFPCIGHSLLAQENSGAKVAFIPLDNLEIPLEYYEKYITEETLLTAISHVSFYNGYKQDIKAIADIVHKKGSYLFVDAYQSAGSVDIDVKKMDIDFLATGSQKYLLGLPGITFLYMKKDIANQLQPRITGWFSQENPFSFDSHNIIFAQGSRRFDTGTPPLINAYAASAAFDILLEVGVNNIASYLQELSSFTINYGIEKGLTLVSPSDPKHKGATTSFIIEDAINVEKKLKENSIIVSSRKDVIRIAPHFYNTKEDIRETIDVLTGII